MAARAVEAARAGATMADAAGYAGVSRSTLQSWLARGDLDNAEPRFRTFRAAFARAKAELVVELTGRIRLGAVDDPRLALGLLQLIERRNACRVAVSGAGGGPVALHDPDELRRISQALTATPELIAAVQAAVLDADASANGAGPDKPEG